MSQIRIPHDDFFVGYLPMPPRLRRFAITATALVLSAVFGLGLLTAWFQQDPGPALRDYETGQVMTGLLVERPYPHLIRRDETGRGAAVLLVGGAKGGASLDPPLFGTVVRLRGNVVARGAGVILEGPTPDGAAPDAAAALRSDLAGLPIEDGGRVTLAGEIVDSKCYFGRMRPGAGRVHRACAQLCISGGVPPLLVVRGDGDAETLYVLASSDGGPAGDIVLPFVAEPVRMSGHLFIRAGLRVLHLEPESITRL